MIKRAPNFVSQVNENDVTLFFYDEIGGWGIWAEDVVRFVRFAQPINQLTLRFHSPGGDIQVAAAITGFLTSARQMGMIQSIDSVVDGACYSVATYIASIGERVRMSELGLWLLHKATASLTDTADGLRQAAETIDALEAIEAESFAKRTGNTTEQIMAWMDGDGSADGTMFTAQQALDAGFVDEIVKPIEIEETDREFTESVQPVRGADRYAASKVSTGTSRGYMHFLPELEENQRFLNRYWRVPESVPADEKRPGDEIAQALARADRERKARQALARVLAV